MKRLRVESSRILIVKTQYMRKEEEAEEEEERKRRGAGGAQEKQEPHTKDVGNNNNKHKTINHHNKTANKQHNQQFENAANVLKQLNSSGGPMRRMPTMFQALLLFVCAQWYVYSLSKHVY